MPGHVERHGPGKLVRPEIVEALLVDLDGAEQILVDRQRGPLEHRPLISEPADITGERGPLQKDLAQLVRVLLRQRRDARSPDRMIDRPPDRLDMKGSINAVRIVPDMAAYSTIVKVQVANQEIATG